MLNPESFALACPTFARRILFCFLLGCWTPLASSSDLQLRQGLLILDGIEVQYPYLEHAEGGIILRLPLTWKFLNAPPGFRLKLEGDSYQEIRVTPQRPPIDLADQETVQAYLQKKVIEMLPEAASDITPFEFRDKTFLHAQWKSAEIIYAYSLGGVDAKSSLLLVETPEKGQLLIHLIAETRYYKPAHSVMVKFFNSWSPFSPLDWQRVFIREVSSN